MIIKVTRNHITKSMSLIYSINSNSVRSYCEKYSDSKTLRMLEYVCEFFNTYGTTLSHSVNMFQLSYCAHLLYPEYVCFPDANENHFRLLEFNFLFTLRFV